MIQKQICILGFLMLLSACSQEQVTDSVGAGAKNWCKNSSNCTVYDEGTARP